MSQPYKTPQKSRLAIQFVVCWSGGKGIKNISEDKNGNSLVLDTSVITRFSLIRDRYKRRRSPSRTPSSDETPGRKTDKGSADHDNKRVEKDSVEGGKKSTKVEKNKKPKGSKLFKKTNKDRDEGGSASNGGGKAVAGSVDYWNDERAKLGLKPLK